MTGWANVTVRIDAECTIDVTATGEVGGGVAFVPGPMRVALRIVKFLYLRFRVSAIFASAYRRGE
jgi:hypothetical protein